MSRPARIKGVAASIGVGVGPARLVARGHRGLSYRRISEDEIDAELDRFARAVEASLGEMELAKRELIERHGPEYAAILDVYLLMHGDALLVGATAEAIRTRQINAQWALGRVVEDLKKPLLEESSTYFKERALDIDHVKEHVLRHLSGERRSEPPAAGDTVLIAQDLTPADAVQMLAPPTVGLVTEMGGPNSHTAILARAFGVPAVVGVGPLPVAVEEDEIVVVDGFSGEVTIGAPLDESRAAEERRERFVAFLRSEPTTNAVTRDGVSISVAANIELPSEVEAAVRNGAEGIGLYRTEFLCLDRLEPPPEDEQTELYRSVAQAIAPEPVVFRTFDLRGDKRLRGQQSVEHERNWLCAQIRAVLRARGDGSVALMLPMVSSVEELDTTRALVEQCSRELGVEHRSEPPIPIGMMVEVPSAALLADRFAEHADFFAVGTNDLLQYTLGIDRGDPRVASAADPLHPAVLALLTRIASAATQAGVPCHVCGDMAADPVGLGVLLGLGYRRVSVPVSVVPLARAVIRSLDLAVAEEAARHALESASSTEARQRVTLRFEKGLGALWRDQGIA